MVAHHHYVQIAGRRIFYREAGPDTAPAVVLLHGTPASSHMYRNLIPALADRYHVIAPDYPGFGHSDVPGVDEFAYTFDNLADHIDALLDHLGVQRYAIYVQDYGAPVGWRLALRHPEPRSSHRTATPTSRDSSAMRWSRCSPTAGTARRPTPPRCASSSAWMA
jgi:pimeloyl-ACP methyl ester carboxylesterase